MVCVQNGTANCKTDVFVLGDVSKEFHKGENTWIGCKKQVALEEQKASAAVSRRVAPFKVMSFKDFVTYYGLESVVEPELLWAFTNTHNVPPPNERMKYFLSIGNTCVCTQYEKELGITNGYSRGRYVLHQYGYWPDDDVLLAMNERAYKPPRAPTIKPTTLPDAPSAPAAAPITVD